VQPALEFGGDDALVVLTLITIMEFLARGALTWRLVLARLEICALI
jgi:hypothetical protein